MPLYTNNNTATISVGSNKTTHLGGATLQRKKAYLALLTQTFIIGFSFLFVKIGLNYASPMDVLAHRFLLAFLVANLIVASGKISLTIDLKTIKRYAPLALFYPVLFFAFQAYGLVYTTSSEAGIIQATVPVFTLIIAGIMLKERTNLLQKSGIVLSVAGVIYISLMNSSVSGNYSFKGLAFITVSALSFAFYGVLVRKTMHNTNNSPFTLTYIILMLGAVVFTSLSVGLHVKENNLQNFFDPLLQWEYVVALLFLAVLSSLASSFLSIYGLKYIEASKAAVFNNLATLITVVAGVLFLNEQLHYYHVIGAVIILAGVFSANRK